MTLSWKKKSFWSGTYYLMDGDRILWQLEGSDGLLKLHPLQESGGVTLVAQDMQVKTTGASVDFAFVVAEARLKEMLARVHLQWDALDMVRESGKPEHNIGSIVSQNGESFSVTIHPGRRVGESFVEAKSQANHVRVHALKTVETTMDLRGRQAAAILLSPVLLVSRRGPFRNAG